MCTQGETSIATYSRSGASGKSLKFLNSEPWDGSSASFYRFSDCIRVCSRQKEPFALYCVHYHSSNGYMYYRTLYLKFKRVFQWRWVCTSPRHAFCFPWNLRRNSDYIKKFEALITLMCTKMQNSESEGEYYPSSEDVWGALYIAGRLSSFVVTKGRKEVRFFCGLYTHIVHCSNFPNTAALIGPQEC